jgi:hypothetical protein
MIKFQARRPIAVPVSPAILLMRCQPASPCGGFPGRRKPRLRLRPAAPVQPTRASDLLQTNSDRRSRPRAPPQPRGRRTPKMLCVALRGLRFRVDHSRRPKSPIRMHPVESRDKCLSGSFPTDRPRPDGSASPPIATIPARLLGKNDSRSGQGRIRRARSGVRDCCRVA